MAFSLNDNSCSPFNPVLDINPGSVNLYQLNLNPPIALKHGDKLYTVANGSISAEVYVYGYKVPSSDVPATTIAPGAQTAPKEKAGG